MNMLSLNRTTSVRSVIVDETGYVLHTDSFKAHKSKGRTYHLKNLPSGNYQLKFYFDGHVVEKQFTK